MKSMCGFEPVIQKQGGTFVSHHMVFHKQLVSDLIEMIIKRNNVKIPWPMYVMSLSSRFYRFSEYLTYSSYLSYFHHSRFHYHEYQCFGKGGLRFRDPNEIISHLLYFLGGCVHHSGISYLQMQDFVFSTWEQYSTSTVFPAYIQLDHVYGIISLKPIVHEIDNERQSETTIESITDSTISTASDSCRDYFSLLC